MFTGQNILKKQDELVKNENVSISF